MSTPRLGVNIDHVATLRQARGEEYPGLVEAARVCLREGADQITIHLREDRRHIQDTDVSVIRLVTKEHDRLFNLEMGCHDEIIAIALESSPDWVCLVPEKREEKTTEGGLDLMDSSTFMKVQKTCQKLKESLPDTKISLFLEADEEVLKRASDCGIDAVEIHTGEYARAFLNENDLSSYFTQFEVGMKFLIDHKLGCHAGHGLTRESVIPLLKTGVFTEYNIGHWVVCDALFSGLANVVKGLNDLFSEYEVRS